MNEHGNLSTHDDVWNKTVKLQNRPLDLLPFAERRTEVVSQEYKIL